MNDELVEQAREYCSGAMRKQGEALVAGLADAVERLQANAVNLRRAWREDSDGQHETNRLLAAERDEARARVAALEAGIARMGIRCAWARSWGSDCKPGVCPDCDLRALLDAGQTDQGDET